MARAELGGGGEAGEGRTGRAGGRLGDLGFHPGEVGAWRAVGGGGA